MEFNQNRRGIFERTSIRVLKANKKIDKGDVSDLHQKKLYGSNHSNKPNKGNEDPNGSLVIGFMNLFVFTILIGDCNHKSDKK